MRETSHLRGARFVLLAERSAWAVGLVCLLSWGVLYAGSLGGRRHELERFAALRAGAPQQTGAPDQSLWSLTRIQAWRLASREKAPPPVAILRIPRLRIELPVLEGTDDAILDRAVGHVAGTAPPGTDGNSGIAGHRDGFFRGLKDIMPGDAVELETIRGIEEYAVERTWIVPPGDVSVLAPTPIPSLTLITCYPFYYVGSAPQRYIVRAVRAADRVVTVAAGK